MRPTQVADWTICQSSSANAAQTLTKAAVTGARHYLSSLTVCISGAAVAATGCVINIKSDTTEIYRFTVNGSTANGSTVHYTIDTPIPCAPGVKMDIVVAAVGTASGVTTVSAAGFTRID